MKMQLKRAWFGLWAAVLLTSAACSGTDSPAEGLPGTVIEDEQEDTPDAQTADGGENTQTAAEDGRKDTPDAQTAVGGEETHTAAEDGRKDTPDAQTADGGENTQTAGSRRNAADAADAETTGSKEETEPEQAAMYTTDRVNMRKQPDIQADILTTVKRGEKVQVYGQDGDWRQAAYKGKKGYIHSSYLSEEEPAAAGYIIAVDAGHQKQADNRQEPVGPNASQTKARVTGGTQGRFTGLPEYELTLQVARKLRDALKQAGYEVLMIRESNDVNISNAERAAAANQAGADAFIRIHANGSEDASKNGVMTICPTPGSPYCSAIYKQSRALSDAVLQGVLSATGASGEGVWETDTMSGINWCQVPVTILEMGYMTNEREDRAMASEEYQDKIVEGIVSGLEDFFSSR